jgi:hypothetical protein
MYTVGAGVVTSASLQVEGAVDEAEERALEVDVLGDEQRDEPDHGGAAVPALVLGVEGAVLSAVRGLLVVHGDERGADDDGRHEQEPDEAAALGHLLPHALPRQNLRHERPRDAQHRQPAVDRLRRRPVELHQTLRARVPVLGTPLLLGPVKLLHWRPLKNPQRVVLLLRLPLRLRLQCELTVRLLNLLFIVMRSDSGQCNAEERWLGESEGSLREESGPALLRRPSCGVAAGRVLLLGMKSRSLLKTPVMGVQPLFGRSSCSTCLRLPSRSTV